MKPTTTLKLGGRMMTVTVGVSDLGREVAARCMDAFSQDAYRSWPEVASLLLAHGFSPREAEEAMRSKWTRWARDMHDGPDMYGDYPATILLPHLDQILEDVREWHRAGDGCVPEHAD